MYKATYKCRMCGETFDGCVTNSQQIANMAIIELSIHGISRGHGNPMDEKEPHTCPDGSIGYADFVGFRREE